MSVLSRVRQASRVLAGRPTGPAVHSPQQRAASVGTAPVRWVSRGRPMPSAWNARQNIERAYYDTLWTYRCVQVRAQALAGLGIRVGADPDRPDDHNPAAPLRTFLTGNKRAPARTLLRWSQSTYDVTGAMAWEIEHSGRRTGAEAKPPRGSRPLRPWPLAPGYLDPIPVAEQGQADWWDGFEYRAPSTGRHVIRLHADRVFYAHRPGLDDWRTPETVLRAARLNVRTLNMHERYAHGFLANDARPAAVVVVQEFGEPGEFEAFKQDWYERHGGPDNAGKPIFVEAGMEDGTTDGAVDATKWLDIKQLGLNQKDAQFIEQYREQLRAICVAFGVPMSILGDASERTFANADAEYRVFWEATMLPVLQEFADHVNAQLAPLFGSDVMWFDLSKVAALQQPSRFQMVTPAVAFADGVLSVNEYRAEIGLPKIDNPLADQHGALQPKPEPVPAQLAVTEDGSGEALPDVDSQDAEEQGAEDAAGERAGQTARAPLTVAAEPPAVLPEPPAVRHVLAEHGPEIVSTLPAQPESPEPAPTPAPDPASPTAPAAVAVPPVPASPEPTRQRQAQPDPGPTADDESEAERQAARLQQWQRADNRSRVLEAQWERAVRAYMDEQRTVVLARLEGKRGRQWQRDVAAHPQPVQQIDGGTLELRVSIGELFSVTYWADKLRTLTRGLLEITTAVAGQAAVDPYDATFDSDTSPVQQAILNRANQLSGQVTDTTYQRIQQQLAQGVDAGETIPQLAERIRAVFADATDRRARVIARTETISASNAAAWLAAEQLGPDLAAGLEWLATPDGRTRDAHREVDGEIVPVGTPFDVGTPPVPMRYPGDPTAPASLVVQCRCSLRIVPPDEMPQPRLVDRDTAERVLALVADGIVRPEHLERVLEVAA